MVASVAMKHLTSLPVCMKLQTYHQLMPPSYIDNWDKCE